jgi:hypothetical protein
MKNVKTTQNRAALLAVALSLAANVSYAQFVDMIPGESTQKNAFLAYQAEQNAADAKLKIVYVGSNQFTDQAARNGAATENTFDEAASDQIIVVENGTFDSALLLKLMAKGNFIISVGSGQSDAAKSALAMLTDIDETGSLQKSEEAYLVNQPSFSATNDDGQSLLSKVSGYFYSPLGSQSFHTSEQSVFVAIAQAIKWASNLDKFPASNRGGNFTVKFTRNHTHRCSYRLNNGDLEYPGYITVQTTYRKQESDNDPNKDYWAIKYQTETDPNQNGPVSAWFTDKLWIISNPQKYITNAQVLSYSPGTSQGTTDTNVGLSFGAGGISGSIGWSFSAPDIYITNSSSSSTDKIGTQFDFDAFKGVGKTPVTVSPGVILKVPQGTTSLWNNLPEEYRGQFIRDWGRYTTKCQASWNL